MMIRSVAVLACLITAAVMGYFIRDINRRFPNPSVCEQYTKDSPAMLDGLEMRGAKPSTIRGSCCI